MWRECAQAAGNAGGHSRRGYILVSVTKNQIHMKITVEIPDSEIETVARQAAIASLKGGSYSPGDGFQVIGRHVAAAIREADFGPVIASEIRAQVGACITACVSEELRRRIKAEVKTLSKDGSLFGQ